MTFRDVTPALRNRMPDLKGRLFANQEMSPITWFRVGGVAQVLFSPQDEQDLCYFLSRLPPEVPLTVVGVCSNVIIRDGGVRGVVIRLSNRGFGQIERDRDEFIRVGAAVHDKRLAEYAEHAHIGGLEFYAGIPGTVGGALRMNAGANDGETKSVLIEANAVDRQGVTRVFRTFQMGYEYRHCGIAAEYIFTSALFRGERDTAQAIRERMLEVQQHRESVQPIREKTGGSTFKNPPGTSAWKLIDQAGCRGLRVGGAQVSEMHCNFLINTGDASAGDIELLGETVRARVKENSGVELQWEIKRIGIPLPDDALSAFTGWVCERDAAAYRELSTHAAKG